MAQHPHPHSPRAGADLLAESDHVAIVRCGATIHFQLGPVTLDLTPAEFAEVAAVVVSAIERLKRREPMRPASDKPH
jgi:hypothetical protein